MECEERAIMMKGVFYFEGEMKESRKRAESGLVQN